MLKRTRRGLLLGAASAGALILAQPASAFWRTVPASGGGGTVAVNFGAKTLKGLGESPLGYAGGGSLSITAGNTGSIWAINSRNNLVAAGTFGAAAPAYSGPYSLTVTDGSAFTATVNITIIANAYHVAWVASGANADSAAGTNQLNTVYQVASLGDTIFLRDGTYNPTTARWILQRGSSPGGVWAGPASGVWVQAGGQTTAPTWTGANPLIIRSENTGTGTGMAQVATVGGGATIKYLELNDVGVSLYTKLQYVTFNNLNAAQNDVTTTLSAGLGVVGVHFLWVDSCYFFSVPNTTVAQYQAALIGSGICSSANCADILVSNSEFYALATGLLLQGPNMALAANTLHQTFTDAMDLYSCFNWNVWFNFSFDKYYDPTLTYHSDHIQITEGAIAAGTHVGGQHIGNTFVRAVGQPGWGDAQGSYQEPDAGSITYTNSIVKGNTYIGGYPRGLTISAATTPECRFNTLIEDTTSGITQPASDLPLPDPPGIYFSAGTGGHDDYNARCQATVLENGQTALTTTTGNVLLSVPSSYAGAFTSPAFGSTLQTLAGVVGAWSMKPAGTLDKATTGQLYNAGSLGTGYVDVINRATAFPI